MKKIFILGSMILFLGGAGCVGKADLTSAPSPSITHLQTSSSIPNTFQNSYKSFSDTRVDFSFEYPENWTYQLNEVPSGHKDSESKKVVYFSDHYGVRMSLVSPYDKVQMMKDVKLPDIQESHPTNDPQRPLNYSVWKNDLAFINWELPVQYKTRPYFGGQITVLLNLISSEEQESLKITEHIIESFKFKK